ncbi:hypothetical protein F4802DRAFT_581631 [Xylaria palmicola]|nr:hypothetical protein F4802DRAFT_581631 [Xylaria palmicola]
METAGSLPGPPGATATPLQPISADRANHQNPAVASLRSPQRSPQRDSDVHDKIRQFNNLAHLPPNTSAMSKQLERMTADAALRRAMVGREEAESEMRRYREEVRALRRQVEEGHDRERKVGERLETVMESYGRAKETYSHTQAIWEKEIRRARKETFKSQSSILKLQEELKAARIATKSIEECLEREKELSKAREQEAFAARYQLVGSQQELDKAQERITFLEEERDAFKAAAQSEEVARIAAEGRLPLPPEDPESEFASPRKSSHGRESLSTFEIVSSAATEAEIEELTLLWQWEKQRADRTQDHLEFVQAEIELYRSQPRSPPRSPFRLSIISSARKERTGPIEIVDPSDLVILGRDTEESEPSQPTETIPPVSEEEPSVPAEPTAIQPLMSDSEDALEEQQLRRSGQKQPRRGTIFVPAEGIFRTLSQHELEAMEHDDKAEEAEEAALEPSTYMNSQPEPARYARTPSVEPPSFALMVQERTSLLSLLNAPRESDAFENPSTTDDISSYPVGEDAPVTEANDHPGSHDDLAGEDGAPGGPRAHTSAAFYAVTTTTTKIPVYDGEVDDENARPHWPAPAPAPVQNRTPSFDVNNPALTPTMTREEALAQIRERRGRARSAMQGAMTPRKQMVAGVTDRNVSAPAGRAAKGRS